MQNMCYVNTISEHVNELVRKINDYHTLEHCDIKLLMEN